MLVTNYTFSRICHIHLFFMSGVIFWTFFEYVMHRFVFHLVSENPRAKRIAYVMHGNHHEFPRDRQRLFMPAVPSLIISSVVFLLMYALMGTNVFVIFSRDLFWGIFFMQACIMLFMHGILLLNG